MRLKRMDEKLFCPFQFIATENQGLVKQLAFIMNNCNPKCALFDKFSNCCSYLSANLALKEKGKNVT